mmetsp:Transcript_14265/g.18529  ORF Transcript_14265/g.18529 Transcript_14265/m.18529 type:complete len:174 (+) Transcript_14265:22-543(+)
MPLAAELIASKQRKLVEQKKVADEMNLLVSEHMEQSRIITKDLGRAIDVASRPGFHNYYKPPEQYQMNIRNDDLKKFTKKVDRLQGDIDSLDAEINQIDLATKKVVAIVPETAQVSSLKQWLARYGTQQPEQNTPPPHYMSTFQPTPKIYGGTNHHKAFKSQATTMTKGILTR